MKKKIRALVRVLQKWLLVVSLFTVYYGVFGLTVILAFLCNRRLFKTRYTAKDSSWLEADGYDCDRRDIGRQS